MRLAAVTMRERDRHGKPDPIAIASRYEDLMHRMPIVT